MSSTSIYIFEAGSTKTDVLIYCNGEKSIITLSGFNPNREDTNFTSELKTLHIPKNAEIHFYGSGAKGEKNQEKISKLFDSIHLSVHSDALAAARSLLQSNNGIVCILGTGGNVVYYNGETIIDQKGGYGFLIDDFGGGLELSRIIVSKWLNEGYSLNTTLAIEGHYQVKKEKFISNFYLKKDLHYLSDICKTLPKLAENDKKLNESLNSYFKTFIDRHVLPMCEKHNLFEVNTVGSIGLHFTKWLEKAAHARGIHIKKTTCHPIEELLKYHLKLK